MPKATASVAPAADGGEATAEQRPSRELAPYRAETATQIDSTHIDRNVEARARAMVDIDAPSVSAQTGAAAVSAPLGVGVDIEEPLADHPVLPGLAAAMLVRVRFAAGEVPLWSLIAPLIVLAALAAALAAAAVSGAPTSADATGASASASASALLAPSARPLASAAPVGSANGATLDNLDWPAGKYSAADVLGAMTQRASREVASARTLQAALDRDPGLVEEPKTLAELRRLSDNPETARVVLETMTKLPAPIAADLLYEVWTGKVQRNDTTELARLLLYSKDVRPKASPALSVALDLRAAESCSDTKAIVPRAEQQGDRRSLHLLLQLQRRYGCGSNKRQDCYPCLRNDDAVENAVKAVRARREPRVLGRR